MRTPIIILTVVLASVMGLATGSRAYSAYPGYDYDEDFLQISVLNDQVVAVRNHMPAESVDLDVDEQVLAVRFEGRTGGVLTTDRFLAISSSSPDWFEQDLETDEADSGTIALSDNMVMLLTQQRAVVFDGRNDAMTQYELPLGEYAIAHAVGERVAAFVTGQRAVAYDPGRQEFRVVAFDPSETFRHLDISYGAVTVETSERLYTFEAATGSWSERSRSELDNRLHQ